MAIKSTSSSLQWGQILCTLWSLMVSTAQPHWVDTNGSHCLVPAPHCKCNKEGFNTFCTGFSYDKEPPKARIGIVSNDDYDPNCDHCRSRIGFGTAGHPDDTSSCGNVARWRADNGNKFIKAMGYILVQWYKNDPVEVLWLLPIRFFFCNKIEQTWKSIAKGHCHSSGK